MSDRQIPSMERTHPGAMPARHLLRVCRAESCQSMGSDSLLRHIENRLGIPLGGTTEGGSITLQPIFCLGSCKMSPAVMLDDTVYGGVTPEVIDCLIDGIRRSQ
jgi:formate dehydrogenase subunit gamma